MMMKENEKNKIMKRQRKETVIAQWENYDVAGKANVKRERERKMLTLG